MEITSIITGLKGVAGYVEEKGKANAQIQLNEAVSALTDLNFENNKLRQNIESLEAKLNARASVVFIDGAYYANSDEGKKRPFCTRCLEVESNLVSVNTSFSPPSCPECKNPYDIEIF